MLKFESISSMNLSQSMLYCARHPRLSIFADCSWLFISPHGLKVSWDKFPEVANQNCYGAGSHNCCFLETVGDGYVLKTAQESFFNAAQRCFPSYHAKSHQHRSFFFHRSLEDFIFYSRNRVMHQRLSPVLFTTRDARATLTLVAQSDAKPWSSNIGLGYPRYIYHHLILRSFMVTIKKSMSLLFLANWTIISTPWN